MWATHLSCLSLVCLHWVRSFLHRRFSLWPMVLSIPVDSKKDTCDNFDSLDLYINKCYSSTLRYTTANSLHHFATSSHSSQQSFFQLQLGLVRFLQGLGAHFVSALFTLCSDINNTHRVFSYGNILQKILQLLLICMVNIQYIHTSALQIWNPYLYKHKWLLTQHRCGLTQKQVDARVN